MTYHMLRFRAPFFTVSFPRYWCAAAALWQPGPANRAVSASAWKPTKHILPPSKFAEAPLPVSRVPNPNPVVACSLFSRTVQENAGGLLPFTLAVLHESRLVYCTVFFSVCSVVHCHNLVYRFYYSPHLRQLLLRSRPLPH